MNNLCELPTCYPVSLNDNDIIYDSLLETFESSSKPACKFDASKYESANGDLKAAFNGDANALKNHYINNGLAEGRSPCGSDNTNCKFDALTYQNQYGDLVAAFNGDVNQITNHYKNNGINEGRSVCPEVAGAPAAATTAATTATTVAPAAGAATVAPAAGATAVEGAAEPATEQVPVVPAEWIKGVNNTHVMIGGGVLVVIILILLLK